MKVLDPNLLKTNHENRIFADIQNGIIGGSAALIRQNGKVVYKQCFGTTVPGGDIPVTEDTVFRLASMTKPITAAAALLLIARGQLKLHDPVENYLPSYSQMRLAALDADGNLTDAGPAQTKVTVFHLLTHTSGIGTIEAGAKQHSLMTAEDNRTLKNAVDYFSRQGLAFDPFSAQAYSGLAAFDVLARIIEVITGKDYNDFLTQEIFEPCGMKDTTFQPSDDQLKRMITMHNRVDEKSCIGQTFANCIFCEVPSSHYLGGAGLVSTVTDYSNFAEMLLNKGCFNGRQIIPADLIDLMATPHVPENLMPGHERWGLGVRVITSPDYKMLPVSTFGWSGAFGTHFWVDPVNRVTAVYLKNSQYDGGSEALTSKHFEADVHASFV